MRPATRLVLAGPQGFFAGGTLIDRKQTPNCQVSNPRCAVTLCPKPAPLIFRQERWFIAFYDLSFADSHSRVYLDDLRIFSFFYHTGYSREPQ